MFSVSTCRFYSITSVYCRTHYETLGVSPRATHKEIKSAYYRLSLLHHPDRQDGNREKFERIANAYKVIGDHASRRLYDQGAFTDSAPTQPRNYYSQSGPQVRRPDAPGGKTPIYDFDLWSRAHYGKTIERRNAAKAAYTERMDLNNDSRRSRKKEMDVGLIIITGMALTGLLSYWYRKLFEGFDYSKEEQKKKR